MLRAPAFWWQPTGLAAGLLRPLGAIYGAIAAARLRRPGARATLPVLCIGDLTVGGAGKTPVVLALAEMLRATGERPCIVTRGYGGMERGPLEVDAARMDARKVGDEALLLARAAPTIVARDRAAGAQLAAKRGASLVLLDDGFQNPALIKDCSLVVVDSENGIGNAQVFPAGPLRAPLLLQLARAQAVIRVGSASAGEYVAEIAEAVGVTVFAARLVPGPSAARALGGKRVLAFAGIARPGKFFASLAEIGAVVTERRVFPDHHFYRGVEAETLLAEARARDLLLVTTEKDLARMQGDPALAELAAAAVPVPVKLEFEDAAAIQALIYGTLVAARPRSMPVLR